MVIVASPYLEKVRCGYSSVALFRESKIVVIVASPYLEKVRCGFTLLLPLMDGDRQSQGARPFSKVFGAQPCAGRAQ